MKALALAGFLLSLGAAAPAWAIPITVSFTAVGFQPFAPEASVSGSFDYNAASVTSNTITSLNSVNLVIAGYTYTLSEVAVTSGADVCGFSCALIGSTSQGLGTVGSFVDGFALYFDAGSESGLVFDYGTANTQEVEGYAFTQFSITADTAGSGTAVPEPNSLLVFLTGLAGLTGLVTQRRRLRLTSDARVGVIFAIKK